MAFPESEPYDVDVHSIRTFPRLFCVPALLVGALSLMPLTANAEEVITRADGFRMIWAPLHRPIEKTYEVPFFDVSERHSDFELLTYAKVRGILDDEVRFHPSDSLSLTDALVWLIRSRNVTNASDVTASTVDTYANRYGLLDFFEDTDALTREQLATLISALDEALKEEVHTVSFYAEDFAGRTTAFGETFQPTEMTAAHRTLPHNTLVRVTDHDSGKAVIVRINDRGPYIEGRNMDLSASAFERLAPRSRGLLKNVTFERLGSAKEISVCPKPRYQRRLGRVSLTPGIPRVVEKGTTIDLMADSSFRLIYIRRPKGKPTRPREWTRRGEILELEFSHVGTYTLILHEDGGKRRRFRTKVIEKCQ